jgi:putative toxin-antitoxin system antitoxin component (TIGR02293 family)
VSRLWHVCVMMMCQMCAMVAAAPPRAVSEAELGRLLEDVEAVMTAVQAEGVSAAGDRWQRIEPSLVEIVDSAIVALPEVARRLVAAVQRLGWLMRSEDGDAGLEDTAVDALETVLECLLAYREGLPVGEDRSSAEILGWTLDTLRLPQVEVAAMLDVSLRTVQRWLRGQARPGAEEAARIRRLARVVNEARFALSAEGVVGWLFRRSPYLEGRTPLDLVRGGPPDVDSLLDRLTATLRYG